MLRVFEVLAKKLQLNLFELAVLHCYIEATGWQIDQKTIKQNGDKVKDYVNCPTDQMEREYAWMLMYLALLGYAAKERMCERKERQALEVVRVGIQQVIVNFGDIYD